VSHKVLYVGFDVKPHFGIHFAFDSGTVKGCAHP
jgi:hypothetical protein